MPSTSWPRRASASAARPAPQPTSSRRAPGRRSSASIQPIRAGFIRCSGFIGPFGSHQRDASRSNLPTSSAETVPPRHGCSRRPATSMCAARTSIWQPITLMTRIVMKFGGTSVADLDRIRNVAHRVKREVEPATRSPSSSPPWPAPPTSWSNGAPTCRRCTTRANMTPSSPPASRSPPACWRSPCRTSASTRAPGRAGRSRCAPTPRTATPASRASRAPS